MRPNRSIPLIVGVLAATLPLAFIAAPLLPRSEQPGSTQIQWRALSQWSASLKPVAYCSEKAAAFRGWELNIGPLHVVRLHPTFARRTN